MNITWIFPDRSTRETTVPHIHQVLFALEVIDSVSFEGTSYRIAAKELTVEADRCFVTVFLATPVIRTVERMELPSTNAAMTWTRRAVLSLFILTIMLEQTRKVK